MLAIVSCKNEEEKNEATEVAVKKKPKVEKLYGFVFDDYDVVRDTIKRGDFFWFDHGQKWCRAWKSL